MNNIQKLIDNVPHEILINFQNVRKQKSEFVKKQQFENAVRKRDEENSIMRIHPVIKDFEGEMINIESTIRDFKLSKILNLK